MKQAMQALLIAPDAAMRRDIVDGEKCITIREGHRDYRLGPVMLCCHLEPWAVMADIISVRHTTFGGLRMDEIHDDGCAKQQDLFDLLLRFYPELKPHSDVTVIRWEKVRGALVPSPPQRQEVDR